METSVRILGATSGLHRHLRAVHRNPSLRLLRRQIVCPNPIPQHFLVDACDSSAPVAAAVVSSSSPLLLRGRSLRCSIGHLRSPSLPPLPSLLSLSVSHFLPSATATPQGAFSSASQPKDGSFVSDGDLLGLEDGNLGFCGEKGATWTVVLLGWLGAELKHLKRYAELYSAKGIRTVRFVVSAKELLRFDLGRNVEERISQFAGELASWCSETEKDGRERHLLFHTFSNTGWLTYGVILDRLRSRPDIIRKIKGCVVDSGAAPEISPQVWAAGFCAAFLKRRSSLTSTSAQDIPVASIDGKLSTLKSNVNSASLPEIFILTLLEMFFRVVLMLPDVNQRLRKIITILSNEQPLCPQLYLYSSSDKVIPVSSVENFIKDQKSMGRYILAYDFGSSPHVDHLRSYPQIYSAKVNEFLEACCLSRA